MSSWSAWLVVGAMGIAVLVACPSHVVDTDPGGEELPNFTVMLHNSAQSTESVSILGPDEVSAPSALLSPGAQRGYLVDNVECVQCEVQFTAIIGAGTPNQRSTSTTCGYSQDNPPRSAAVIWNGTSLVCVGWGGVSGSGSTGDIWVLAGSVNPVGGTWGDIFGTATGTLTFIVPTQVQEGEIALVSATFEGTVTDTQWNPNNPNSVGRQTGFSVGIVDRGVPGLNFTDGGQTERAQPTAEADVTVAGPWTIPVNPTTLSIEAAGGFAMAGPGIQPIVATYRKLN